jgi:hypothetical protein
VNCENVPGKTGSLSVSSDSPHSMMAIHYVPLVSILGQVGYVEDGPHEIISIEDASVSPVALDFLRFVAGGAEVIHDLQDGLGEPFRRHRAAVIELDRKQHFVAPPSAAS